MRLLVFFMGMSPFIAKRHIWKVEEGWSQKSLGTTNNPNVSKFDKPGGTRSAPDKLGRSGHRGRQNPTSINPMHDPEAGHRRHFGDDSNHSSRRSTRQRNERKNKKTKKR